MITSYSALSISLNFFPGLANIQPYPNSPIFGAHVATPYFGVGLAK
jgi:hypothetical protein